MLRLVSNAGSLAMLTGDDAPAALRYADMSARGKTVPTTVRSATWCPSVQRLSMPAGIKIWLSDKPKFSVPEGAVSSPAWRRRGLGTLLVGGLGA